MQGWSSRLKTDRPLERQVFEAVKECLRVTAV